LYETTHAAVDKYQPGPRVVDVTQNILDMAVQKVVERLSWRLLQESDATPASVGLPELLDLCIDGIAHKYLIVSAAYKVLEDVMEAQTISTYEKMWDLVEERKDKLSTRDIHSETGRPTKAALCLLRMCNALLRRVSKTHNSVFCGRILVFLSFTFALSERSAVNLTGKVSWFELRTLGWRRGSQCSFSVAERVEFDDF
jgi:THO complex subunit 1